MQRKCRDISNGIFLVQKRSSQRRKKLPTGKLVIDVDEMCCNDDESNSSEQLNATNLIEELVALTKNCMSKLCELRRALKQS